MTRGNKLLLLALSLLLPAVLLVCTHVFVTAQMHAGADDRALVWVQTGSGDIGSARSRITTHAVFSGGQVRDASPDHPAPESCGARAFELSFGSLTDDDAQAAREELEHIAAQAGLTVCASHHFRLNDPGTETAARQAGFAAQHVAMFLGVPAGMCLLLYWMFRDQLAMPGLRAGKGMSAHLLLGLAGATGMMAISIFINTMAGEPVLDAKSAPFATLGPGAMFLVLSLTTGSPVIEEIAYRSWLITLSERVIGAWPAAVMSTALFTLSHQPTNLADAATLLALGGVCSMLYLRTRSLAAVATTHAGFDLMTLALGATFA